MCIKMIERRCNSCVNFIEINKTHGHCLFVSGLIFKNKIPCVRYELDICGVKKLNNCDICGILTTKNLCIECQKNKNYHSDLESAKNNKELISKIKENKRKEQKRIINHEYYSKNKVKINKQQKERYLKNKKKEKTKKNNV